ASGGPNRPSSRRQRGRRPVTATTSPRRWCCSSRRRWTRWTSWPARTAATSPPCKRWGGSRMTPACCLFLLLAAAADPVPEPPPLTEDQRARISKLANDTKQEADRLKGLLDQNQRALAGVYDQYELDEAKATKLEAEILDVQKQMLANHRKMQVE